MEKLPFESELAMAISCAPEYKVSLAFSTGALVARLITVPFTPPVYVWANRAREHTRARAADRSFLNIN
jgi:hypothetical protein